MHAAAPEVVVADVVAACRPHIAAAGRPSTADAADPRRGEAAESLMDSSRGIRVVLAADCWVHKNTAAAAHSVSALLKAVVNIATPVIRRGRTVMTHLMAVAAIYWPCLNTGEEANQIVNALPMAVVDIVMPVIRHGRFPMDRATTSL